MAKVKVKREGNLLWEDECQPLTTAQINEIKNQFHPSNTANVNIVPYHIYDEDGEEIRVGEVRKTIDGVKKSKPVYKRTIKGTSPSGTSLTQFADISSWNIEEVQFVSNIINYTKDGYNKVLTDFAGDGNTGNMVTWEVDLNSKKFYVQVGTWRTSIPLQFTFRYTKTSDEWEEV